MKTYSQPLDSIPENAKSRLNEILPGFSGYGFNLHGSSTNEHILLANKTAIIVRYSDELNYLIATYDFDPEDPALGRLKDAFEQVRVVFIRHSLKDATPSGPYHKIPQWLKNFKNLDCVIFDNVDLQDISTLEGWRLKFLGILRADNKDVRHLIQSIGRIDGLEFLMYESIFSTKDIEELKKTLPELIAFRSGK